MTETKVIKVPGEEMQIVVHVIKPERDEKLKTRQEMLDIIGCGATKFRDVCIKNNLPYYDIDGMIRYKSSQILPYFEKKHGEELKFKGLKTIKNG